MFILYMVRKKSEAVSKVRKQSWMNCRLAQSYKLLIIIKAFSTHESYGQKNFQCMRWKIKPKPRAMPWVAIFCPFRALYQRAKILCSTAMIYYSALYF